MAVSAAASPTRPSRRTSNQLAQQQPWTTARCHRLLRPLISKLQALRNIIGAAPSITATPNVHVPKELKPEEQSYVPAQAATTRASRRSSTERSLFFGGLGRPSRKPRQTYASSRRNRPSGSRNASRLSAAAVDPSNDRNPLVLIQTPNFNVLSATIDEQAQAAKERTKPLDLSEPLALLNALRPFVHSSIFTIYLGIFTSFETILTSTTAPESRKSGPSALKTLAARKIAHCILATQSQVDSDDIWYDTAANIGLEGEHLCELVRWHAIEVLRDALLEHLMPAKKNGLSFATALIGLCRLLNANTEAEALLESMIKLHPLAETTKNPALTALELFWAHSLEIQYRILGTKMLPEAKPEAVGNPKVITIVRRAIDDIEHCAPARLLVTSVLEAAFGVWGEDYTNTLTKERKELLRRKGNRRVAKSSDSSIEYRKISHRIESMPTSRVSERAEAAILAVVEKLFVAALSSENSPAVVISRGLVDGFLCQDDNAKSHMDVVWEEWYPVSGKIVLLLQNLGNGEGFDGMVFQELVRCLEDIHTDCGDGGIKGLAEFLADCYGKLYYSSGSPRTERDEMKCLIDRLLIHASPGITFSSKDSHDSSVLKTPGPRRFINNSPVKQETDAHREKERYFIAQLAIRIATEFAGLGFAVKNESWIKWLSKVEYHAVGLKVQTPARVSVVISERKDSDKGQGRKGWRWEEGIDAWVAVGGTPGRGLREKKIKRRVLDRVVIQARQGRHKWRDEYSIFEDDADDEFASEDDEEPIQVYEDADTLDSPSTSSSLSPRSTSPESPCTEPDDDDSVFDTSSDSATSISEYEERIPESLSPAHNMALRRSPRSAKIIKRSLQAFVVVPPNASPVFAERRMNMTRTRARKPFNFAELGGSSPVLRSSPRNVQRVTSEPSSCDDDDDEEEDTRKTPLKRRSPRRVKEQEYAGLEPSGAKKNHGTRKSPRIVRKRKYVESETSSEEEEVDASYTALEDESFEDELSFSGVGVRVVLPITSKLKPTKRDPRPAKRTRMSLRTHSSPRQNMYSEDELL